LRGREVSIPAQNLMEENGMAKMEIYLGIMGKWEET
jgi:hypothetical protein